MKLDKPLYRYKPVYKLAALTLVAGAALLVSACSDSDSPGSQTNPPVDPNMMVPDPIPENIANWLLGEGMDYGTVLRLIEEADLTIALQGDNSGMGWTLFAPPDTAFVNDEFESMNSEQMKSLIRNHLYSGRLAFSELVPGPLEMTEGTVEIVENPGAAISVGGARVVARDRTFENGIIHFVDSVLQSQ